MLPLSKVYQMTKHTSNPPEGVKRLTFDVPAELHLAIKVYCAKRGLKIGAAVTEMLIEKFITQKPL
jgi:hypothetical protein